QPVSAGDFPDVLRSGLRAVLVGTRGRSGSPHRLHYYDGAGNHFWTLLHASGLSGELLDPADDARVLEYGLGLTDLVYRDGVADVRALHAKIRRYRPGVVAFVSKTAASSYASVTAQRRPRGYGALSWTVAGRPAFVLPGSSGANNAMPLPMRAAMWRDLDDFIASV
ncbi:MAG TPA: mismatch-specific DNA-glycosylase, partial [Jatrophihabitantaceae bacterium]